jgi:hypothetical protein
MLQQEEKSEMTFSPFKNCGLNFNEKNEKQIFFVGGDLLIPNLENLSATKISNFCSRRQN